MCGQERDGRGAIGGGEHAVALALEGDLDEMADLLVVLGDQHGLRAAGQRRLEGDVVRFLSGVGEGGQEEVEGGAAAHGALHGDPALVLCDDAIDGGQPKAGALARGLGGEERLEDSAQVLRRDAGPGVGDGEMGAVAGGGPGVLNGVGLVDQGDIDGELEFAASGHGVAGVDGEVEQRLLEHAGIGAHGDGLGHDARGERDVLTEDTAHELAHVLDEFAEVDGLLLLVLLAAEGEELAGEAGGAFGGGGDLVDGLAAVAIEVGQFAERGDLELDDREQVVEVVGDAAGQAADGVHLLRLAELILKLDAGRDVLLDGDEVGDAAIVALHRGDDRLFGEELAVLAPALDDTVPLPTGFDRGPHALVVLGRMSARFEHPRVLAENVRRDVAGGFRKPRVDVFDASLGVGDDDGDRRLLDGAGETADLLLGEPAVGDVAGDVEGADDGTGLVAHGTADGVNVARAALAGHGERLLAAFEGTEDEQAALGGVARLGHGFAEELGVVAADDVGDRAAEEARAGGVDVLVASLGVLDVDGIGGAFDDGIETSFGFAQAQSEPLVFGELGLQFLDDAAVVFLEEGGRVVGERGRRCRGWGVGGVQQGGDELVGFEGFDEEAHGAERERKLLVLGLGVDGGEEDEGDVAQRRVALHFAAELEAVHAGHHHIRYDEVIVALLEHAEGLGAVVGGDDLMARGAQDGFEQVPVLRSVVDVEDSHGGGRLRWRRTSVGKVSGSIGLGT